MDLNNLKSLFDAVNTGLGVIKTVAETPGVNVLPYASTIAGAIGLLQFAYEKGMNIAAHVAAFNETFKPGVIPAQDKLDALNARMAELRTALHAPLPPKEEGEPD